MKFKKLVKLFYLAVIFVLGCYFTSVFAETYTFSTGNKITYELSTRNLGDRLCITSKYECSDTEAIEFAKFLGEKRKNIWYVTTDNLIYSVDTSPFVNKTNCHINIERNPNCKDSVVEIQKFPFAALPIQCYYNGGDDCLKGMRVARVTIGNSDKYVIVPYGFNNLIQNNLDKFYACFEYYFNNNMKTNNIGDLTKLAIDRMWNRLFGESCLGIPNFVDCERVKFNLSKDQCFEVSISGGFLDQLKLYDCRYAYYNDMFRKEFERRFPEVCKEAERKRLEKEKSERERLEKEEAIRKEKERLEREKLEKEETIRKEQEEKQEAIQKKKEEIKKELESLQKEAFNNLINPLGESSSSTDSTVLALFAPAALVRFIEKMLELGIKEIDKKCDEAIEKARNDNKNISLENLLKLQPVQLNRQKFAEFFQHFGVSPEKTNKLFVKMIDFERENGITDFD